MQNARSEAVLSRSFCEVSTGAGAPSVYGSPAEGSQGVVAGDVLSVYLPETYTYAS